MRLLANFVLAAAIVVAVFGALFLTDGFQSREPLGWVLASLSVVIPLAIAIWVWRLSARQGKAAFDRILAGEVKATDHKWFYGSGIAIDKPGQRIVLADAGATRVVGFRDLVEHKYVPARSRGHTGGTGVIALVKLAATAHAAARDYNEAGFHVVVQGPGQTRWRLYSVGQRDADKWGNYLDEARFAAQEARAAQ